MTNRNVRRRVSRPGRSRTARRVWVNEELATTLTINTIQIVDLMTAAVDFMKFDATILGVILSGVTISWDAAATLGINRFGITLEIGKDTLDSADMESPLQTGIGPPWMFQQTAIFRQAAAAVTVNQGFGPVGDVIRIKSKRRFRENDATLWLTVENSMVAGATNIQLNGMARTLLLVP